MHLLTFFLDHSDENLKSSIDLFNLPSTKLLEGYKEKDLYIHAFFSNGKVWKNKNLGKLKINKFKNLVKSDLDTSFSEQTVFVCLSEKENFNISDISRDEKVYEPYPPWRSNIKLFSEHSDASYQGEIPKAFLDLKLSLVSCSPMFQNIENVQNYFYLVNINRNPKIETFIVKILNEKKDQIGEISCKTNSHNFTCLDDVIRERSDLMIFTSEDHGGIPIYFSKDKDSRFLSMEHTHPPVEHVFMGKRHLFQKKKKSYWFSGKI